MFGMPIILVIVVTGIQRNTFDSLNKNKVELLLCNKDTGVSGTQLIDAIDRIGMFKILQVSRDESEIQIKENMSKKNVLLGILIPANFSIQVDARAKNTAGKALNAFGLEGDTTKVNSGNQQ